MRTTKIDNDGYTALLPMIITVAVAIILLVGVHVWHNRTSTQPTSLQNQPSSSSIKTPFPKGNLDNTFVYADEVFPNLSDNYNLLRQTKSPLSPPSPVDGSVESDYITDKSIADVHADMIVICHAHGFAFLTSDVGYPTFDCYGSSSTKNAVWGFNIVPASNLVDQTWYTQSNGPQPISSLVNKVWLQIYSGEIITD